MSYATYLACVARRALGSTFVFLVLSILLPSQQIGISASELMQRAKVAWATLPASLRPKVLLYIAGQEAAANLEAAADYETAFQMARSQPALDEVQRNSEEFAVLNALQLEGKSDAVGRLLTEATPEVGDCWRNRRCSGLISSQPAILSPDSTASNTDSFDFYASIAEGTWDVAAQSHAAKTALGELTTAIAAADPVGVAELAVGMFELGKTAQVPGLLDLAFGGAAKRAAAGQSTENPAASDILRTYGLAAEIDLPGAVISARELRSGYWRAMVFAHIARIAAERRWRPGETITVWQ